MSVTIKGVDALLRKLGKAAAQKTLEAPMQRAVLRVQARMQEYPPPLPPKQGPLSRRVSRSKRSVARFRQGGNGRTGTYGRRWTTRINRSGEGLVGKVGNNVAYGPYVGSAQWQARQHRGRWNVDSTVVKEESPTILADFTRTIDQALAG